MSTQCRFNAGPPLPALAINHSTLLSVDSGVSTEYKLTPIQCLLNVGLPTVTLAHIQGLMLA